MQSLMDYGTVAELLQLDARDEKRNRMLLGAVTEAICFYLDRNIVLDTMTECIIPYDGVRMILKEYPVRKIESIIEAATGKQLNLAPEIEISDISQPGGHLQAFLKLDSPYHNRVKITYQYGYAPNEVPQLIQATMLDMLRDRLLMYSKIPDYDISDMDKDRLMNITRFRRLSY